MSAVPPGVEEALVESGTYFLELAAILVPMFLAGSFLVGLAGEYLPPEAVERKLRHHDEGVGNVLAAGFGAVTPFCSCSTVPALAGLLQAGAPLGLAFSFLLASPLVNEIAIVFLLGLFGPQLTVVYVASTFVAAVVGGIVVGRVAPADAVKDLQVGTRGDALATDGGTVDCGSRAGTVARSHRRRVGAAARGAWSFFLDTGPYLVFGLTVGALVHGAVPVGMVRAVLGPENPVAVPLAALLGAPVYVSISGMLPIAASLNGQGIAIGTVIAFVVGGAGVSLPNLVLLNKLFERRLLGLYVAAVVVVGTLVGVLLNLTVA